LYVDLVIVVLAGLLKQAAELQGVITLDPGEAVGQIVDGARGVRGYGPPLNPEKLVIFTVGMRFGISFPCGNI